MTRPEQPTEWATWDILNQPYPYGAVALHCTACHKVAARFVVSDDERARAASSADELYKLGTWYAGGVRTPCACAWSAWPDAAETLPALRRVVRRQFPGGSRGSGVTLRAAPR